MQKFERLAETITKQIEKGDFTLSGLPSERILSEQLAANRLTVRKALLILEKQNIIKKLKNGRYAISAKANSSEKNIRIALLAPPAFSSGNIRIWHDELQICTAKCGFFFRPFLFLHWNDASISDIMTNFDGTFIIPRADEEDIPFDLQKQFKAQKGLVMLNADMSQHQILSINPFPSISVQKILDELGKIGHKSIACIHLQTNKSHILNNRISQWEYWSNLNDNKAPCIKANINPFKNGEKFLNTQVKKGRFKNATAVFCTTIHAAIAFIRVCKNNGINPEKDIAICTIDDEGIGMHSTPSVSCFENPNTQKILRPIFNWIKTGGDIRTWKGPLLIEPVELKIYKGETWHAPSK